MTSRLTSLKRLLLLAAILFAPAAALPAVAYDAFTWDAGAATSFNFTHTPSGTPRGAAIICIQRGSSTPEVVSVTYGGNSMTEMTGSPQSGLAAGSDDTMVNHAFFIGSSLPTGAQTVAVSKDGANNMSCGIWTVTAASDTTVQDTDVTILTSSAANPTATLSLGGNTSFVAEAFRSGQNVDTAITPYTNWTSSLENDVGSFMEAWYTYDIIGSTDVTMGWTQGADDAVAFGFAITESGGGGGVTQILTLQDLGKAYGPHRSQQLNGVLQ